MRLFGYNTLDGYGITCGIIIAETEKEAKEILKNENLINEPYELTEISIDKKGYTEIGSYWE